MERLPGYGSNSRCWNNSDPGIRPINLYTNGLLSNASSVYNSQDEEMVDLSLAPGPYPTNSADSSFFNSHWTAYPDEIQPVPTAQTNTKVQRERSDCGNEADLNGLVANILDEQDKPESCSDDGISSLLLKSLWPLNLHRASDRRGLVPDMKEDFRGVEPFPSTETHRQEDLFCPPPGIQQDDRWPRARQNDNPNSYNISPRTGLNEWLFPKSCSSPAPMLCEAPKDLFQNRETLVPPLNNFSFFTEPDRYDSQNNIIARVSNNLGQGFHEGRSFTNVSPEPACLDVEVYARRIQQSCQKPNDFMASPSFSPASERSFIPDGDHNSNYGSKAPGRGRRANPNHSPTMAQRCDEGAHSVKPNGILPASNAEWPLWANSQPQSNFTNTYQNQMRVNSLPASQKSPMLGFSPSSTCSLPESDSNLQSHRNEKRQYSYHSKQTNDRLGGTREECVSGRRMEPFNGLHENVLSRCNSHEDVGNRIHQDKRMQYSAEPPYSECRAQAYHRIIGNTAHCGNQRPGSNDKSPLPSNKAIHPNATCSMHASLMVNIPNKVTSLCDPCQSCARHKVAACNLPLMGNYVFNEQGQCYPGKPGSQCFLTLPMATPRQEVNDNLPTSDCLPGGASLQNMASILSFQKSSKLRSRFAAKLHVYLEECFLQCRFLEEERMKIECSFRETFPGRMVSSVKNIVLQKLPPNPSRVDRLIVDHFHEQARVVTLLGKMERYSSAPFHANIHTVLAHYLETIHTVKVRRREETSSTSGRQKHKKASSHDGRDVCALATSIGEMTAAAQKVRTVLWCALQMMLSGCPGRG